ncbi:MAG TPA: MFS transporter [Thermoanaerobaculia bacterium]|nr:MFS transporter [Thermoanaerobaculia bacterium]HQR67070.1 MFS transporter [Thermoanaerobaculia bacterium]
MTAPAPAERPAGTLPLLRSFPRVFWVANVMELFERAAYYGLNSVLAVYLTAETAKGGLGFTESSVGFLQSLIYACNYVVPIVGGALADRYGYRRMLLVAFSCLSVGYFASGHMSAYGAVFASLLLMAAGGGLFKPIISGTIARTTDESNSGFGFGIYYWMINLGAFLAPLAVSILRGFSWRWVFLASSAYCALMFLPTLFAYRDPPRPASTKSLSEVARGAAMILGDARFMLLIVVYSLFWVLYFQNFGSVLWFLRDFVDPGPANRLLAAAGLPFRFDAEFVTVINAGTIILLQVLVSRIVKDWRPVRTMVAGIALGALGFLCLAFTANVWTFVAGIAVFSIGEMTAHPKYYSYVGLVAEEDKKAVFMGYAFLYGVFGSLVGSSLGGALYGAWLKPLAGTGAGPEAGRTFWLLFVALDLVAVAGLVLYDRVFSKATPESVARARAVMRVVYALFLAAGAGFLWKAVSGPEVSWKTLVQALILVLLGASGLFVGRRQAATTS